MRTPEAILFTTGLAALALAACAAPTHRTVSTIADATARLQRADVAETIIRFSQATVRHDFDAMARAFETEAVWEASGHGLAFRLQGIAAIRAALASSHDSVNVVFQQIGPPVVLIQGDGHATAETTVFELLRLEETGVTRFLTGVYHDELSSRNARWAFTRRSFVLHHQTGWGKDAGDPRVLSE